MALPLSDLIELYRLTLYTVPQGPYDKVQSLIDYEKDLIAWLIQEMTGTLATLIPPGYAPNSPNDDKYYVRNLANWVATTPYVVFKTTQDFSGTAIGGNIQVLNSSVTLKTDGAATAPFAKGCLMFDVKGNIGLVKGTLGGSGTTAYHDVEMLVEIPIGGNTGITDAPSTAGAYYVRNLGTWAKMNPFIVFKSTEDWSSRALGYTGQVLESSMTVKTDNSAISTFEKGAIVYDSKGNVAILTGTNGQAGTPTAWRGFEIVALAGAGGSGTMNSVVHDTTLIGSGITSSPLGLAAKPQTTYNVSAIGSMSDPATDVALPTMNLDLTMPTVRVQKNFATSGIDASLVTGKGYLLLEYFNNSSSKMDVYIGDSALGVGEMVEVEGDTKVAFLIYIEGAAGTAPAEIKAVYSLMQNASLATLTPQMILKIIESEVGRMLGRIRWTYNNDMQYYAFGVSPQNTVNLPTIGETLAAENQRLSFMDLYGGTTLSAREDVVEIDWGGRFLYEGNVTLAQLAQTVDYRLGIDIMGTQAQTGYVFRWYSSGSGTWKFEYGDGPTPILDITPGGVSVASLGQWVDWAAPGLPTGYVIRASVDNLGSPSKMRLTVYDTTVVPDRRIPIRISTRQTSIPPRTPGDTVFEVTGSSAYVAEYGIAHVSRERGNTLSVKPDGLHALGGIQYTAATEYWLDNDMGNDANDGLTSSTAWKTEARLKQELDGKSFDAANGVLQIRLVGTSTVYNLTGITPMGFSNLMISGLAAMTSTPSVEIGYKTEGKCFSFKNVAFNQSETLNSCKVIFHDVYIKSQFTLNNCYVSHEGEIHFETGAQAQIYYNDCRVILSDAASINVPDGRASFTTSACFTLRAGTSLHTNIVQQAKYKFDTHTVSNFAGLLIKMEAGSTFSSSTAAYDIRANLPDTAIELVPGHYNKSLALGEVLTPPILGGTGSGAGVLALPNFSAMSTLYTQTPGPASNWSTSATEDFFVMMITIQTNSHMMYELKLDSKTVWKSDIYQESQTSQIGSGIYPVTKGMSIAVTMTGSASSNGFYVYKIPPRSGTFTVPTSVTQLTSISKDAANKRIYYTFSNNAPVTLKFLTDSGNTITVTETITNVGLTHVVTFPTTDAMNDHFFIWNI